MKWLYEDMTARIMIPADIIAEDNEINGLVQYVKDLITAGYAYKYKADANFIFYFREILAEHLEVLEKNEVKDSILIEYK